MPGAVGAVARAVTKAPWTFFFLALFIHGMDYFVRYGSTIYDKPVWWGVMGILYFLLWLDARALDVFQNIPKKALAGIAVTAYLWGPFWSIMPSFFPAIETVAAILLLFAPVWPTIVLLTGNYESWLMRFLSVCFIIFWFVMALFSTGVDIQDYASDRGFLPGSLTPAEVITYGTQAAVKAFTTFWRVTTEDIPKKLAEETERALAAAKGDYYTGRVDSASKKRLGVYLDRFRAADPYFYENSPVTAYVTMKAETIDIPLDIDVTCEATQTALLADKGPIKADRILPQSYFNVITSDQYDIDCIWNKGKLEKGSHNLEFKAAFDFTTRAYKRAYVMSRDRYREYRRQNTDPLKGVSPRDPPAIYTTGPVRIGMGVGPTQPIALGEQGDNLQPWGITIDNAWEGKITEVKNVLIFVPEGLKVIDPTGEKLWEKRDCTIVPLEEREACDDTLVDVYQLSEKERTKREYKNLTTKSIRVYLEIVNPQKVIGASPIAVQNFKASIQYRYELKRKLPITIRELTV